MVSIFYLFSSPILSGRRLDVYTWCGLSVNLECRSETWCTRLAEKYRTQKSPKNSPSAHYRTTLSGYILATKAYTDNRKKLLSSNISSRCPRNMVIFGPLAAEIGPVVGGTPANFTGLASWQRYCTVLQQWASAKLCGVEQRTQPIGPYSARRPYHVWHRPTF